jgi:hypothetical protein
MRAEVVIARVDRRAAQACEYAGFTQDGHGLAIVERVLDRTQLSIEFPESRQLGAQELVPAPAEAVQVEHQTAEVAV